MALSSGLKKGVGAVTHFFEREKMKKRDEEIEEERNREREIELKNTNCKDEDDIINHFSHRHPLHKSYSTKPVRCNSCYVTTPHGWAYTCEAADCTYSLHKVCSGGPVALRPSIDPAAGNIAPGQLITTFAHLPEHPVKDVYSNAEFLCGHCYTSGKGRRYKCDGCDVSLHPVCAKNPTRLSTFMHPQHELELRTKKHFKDCNICGHSLKAGEKAFNLRVYGCKDCNFLVHPVCSQLPQYLVHDLHPMTDPLHPLQLKLTTSKTKCDRANCGSDCTPGWHYVCSICSVSFHIQCIQPSVDQNKSKIDWYSVMDITSALVDLASAINSN